MPKFLLLSVCLLLTSTVFGQEAKALYEEAIQKKRAGTPQEALALLDRALALDPEYVAAYYERGIVKVVLIDYEAALPDFDTCIRLFPDSKKAYMSRGYVRRVLTDYEGAISDLNTVIKLDMNSGEAYLYRGFLHELLGRQDSACADFYKALQNGHERAKTKVDACMDTTQSKVEIHRLLRLTEAAGSNTYGFSPDNPIKVGVGPDGGPSNQRAYIMLLRDAQGKSVAHRRINSCCPYRSTNAPLGQALLDRYEITYRDEKGAAQKADIYISMYDYEAPKILWGFGTVKPPR